MDFRTKLKKYESQDFIDYGSKILLIGSCFSEHLFNYLDDAKYSAFLNPCGISFNPSSITNSIYYAQGFSELKETEIKENMGTFFHYDFHSSFSNTTQEKIYESILKHLKKAKEYSKPDVLIISLGTSFVYKVKSTGELVNNCHKIPQDEFEKIFLTSDETVDILSKGFDSMINENKDLKIIITVSPVRHLKDGMVENSRSKANLINACHRLTLNYDNVSYFPSFEILIDELRDYRFYKDDMVHPSDAAVSYILENFEQFFMNSNEEEKRRRIQYFNKQLSHRPFLVESTAHQKFLQKLRNEIRAFAVEHGIDYKAELAKIESQIIS